MIESPLSNRNRIRILLLLSFDDDSVPNTEVNVPLEPLIFPPEAHPGSHDVGTPEPRYAANILAQPFVPESAEVHAELSGKQTQHPP